VKHCGVIGVQTLTLFAFSSENKNRCEEEVTLLFKLFLSVLRQEGKKPFNVSASTPLAIACWQALTISHLPP
jgi:undecaprenyl diphosphate synthase